MSVLANNGGASLEGDLGRRRNHRAESSCADSRWSRLDLFVYSLIDQHEPRGDQQARLRADLQIMCLSGLNAYDKGCAVQRECKQAAQIMSELSRLLCK
jgi:hypothetical protein